MAEPFRSEILAGWGRYNPAPCRCCRPERQDALLGLLEVGAPGPVLARGLGRSYGDTAVNREGAVVDMTRLNRMRSFDPETGVLDCEAGVGLGEILDVFAPRGWFLPVVPGTKFVTVGGAIANDVHGKNHHRDGSFGNFVESFELWTPAEGVLHCSPEENGDVFWATVGGIGLTGVILSARLRLRAVASAYVAVDYLPCANLDAALEAMDGNDDEYEYSVGWVDCLSRDENLGRTVLMRGNPAAPDRLPPGPAGRPHTIPRRMKFSVPADFPQFMLNPYSIKAFNDLFYRFHDPVRGRVVDYDKYFFPLDRIHHWNRMYGRRGFVQYQATVPLEAKEGLRALLDRCSLSRRASFLAVLKKFGAAGRGLLSHPMPGYTLTLDLPNSSGLADFLREMDQMLLGCGGRLYLAKDAAAAPETIAAMYPRLGEFAEIRRRLDPAGRIDSDMARRLCLAGAMKEASHD